MHFEILVNPTGASGKAWKKWLAVEPLFRSGDCTYTLRRSEKEYGIEEMCRELTSRGEETALVVIGGDGTQNEAVNGIVDFERTKYGFIPCGTGNDMVRDMGLPSDTEELVRRMLDGTVKREADVGELTFRCEDGSVIKRRFNISSDVGFGAATCELVNRSRLKPILNRFGLGRLIYIIKAIRVCFTARPSAVTITCGGKTKRYKKCLCAVAMNHCHEGGGLKFCPDADYADGQLDLCIGNGLSHPEFVMMLPKALKGKHLSMRGVYSERAEHIAMRSDEPLWVHTDGEVIGRSRSVEMRILGSKLKMLV
ncbi:lipid kinase, YegS/Rv2252/BmrU family [Ruminococcus sp. YE71]|uniref:diacylglycerol/lipid kinase family protein n=1 Tax=unclassified Ruminococcus TaxID=2608920 RepID=UPI00088FDAF0|nr:MULTISPECIES: YegS/Rv2252/BmrU family lipid kinase [unclassified Ruminococcus]SDA15880.1 lipid kinase, YegS/Rv2252/BmrU family [Ruminococcus sp. YE78]SFW23379.1 lipid kinase, YegS/Rv2252/BmrU family [Ruminococcus sp. YE71]